MTTTTSSIMRERNPPLQYRPRQSPPHILHPLRTGQIEQPLVLRQDRRLKISKRELGKAILKIYRRPSTLNRLLKIPKMNQRLSGIWGRSQQPPLANLRKGSTN
ncbi:hypothetical protein EMPG_14831 [Blastomyces silverae]|uniref:Uncharacterized protein n=1 Tax=Blastomyces silverae TaxID=2060906 RepID=A0A0H1BE39_9EURO|nr:hypothetical protein EMPG_14831 [Blastomyces silverae]